ncbi:DNA-binding transcriptional regulator, XRE-family HTH domain [Candidatus Electrothrix aarhusensis]|uniref:DNA-binding transcriptional regulator, XRE-family HTH domain n=1 Tax=Candidatus Electrothrix aarhusensis TaxID=1859131 RepID=A0A444J1N2_9BACT|nr:DNA-binding transcriptional regulator, XRE-family HTH domain [Candidatus Electrothrix aarhusensis]
MNEEDILKEFGNTLQKYRKEKDWSQEKLSEVAYLDRTYISSVERGQRNISIINICKLANALEIPIGNLLRNVGDYHEQH